MAMLQTTPASVKSMDVQAILKRGIGKHQAAQVAANMVRNRAGEQSLPIKVLPADEKAFFYQLADKMIDAFEEGAFDKQPQSLEESRRLERDAYLLIERQTAQLAAASRGHEMGPWGNVPDRFDETSACVRCSRVAVLVVSYEATEIEIRRHGTALTEGCLSAAPEVA